MKKMYEAPEIELIVVEAEDVVTTSYIPGPDEGDPDIF